MNSLKLSNFLKKYNHLPIQGSKEWLDKRKYKIGGSEISTILNKNKYQSINDLIYNRIGITEFSGNIMTTWGNIFEEIIKEYNEKIFNCRIYETGSIPHSSELIAYSPDGLAVIDNKYIIDYFNEINITDNSIVLFEFKCPYSRIPTNDIPEHYINQPKLGLEVIDICNISIFIEGIFRICSYEELIYNNSYNIDFHKKDNYVFDDINPLYHGLLLFYVPKNEINGQIRKMINTFNKYLMNKNINVTDLGNFRSYYQMNELFELYRLKKIKLTYIYSDFYNSSIFEDELKELYNIELQTIYFNKINNSVNLLKDENEIIGILPYKLIDVYINPVYKNEDPIINDKILSNIKNIFNIIDDYNIIKDTIIDIKDKKKFIISKVKEYNL